MPAPQEFIDSYIAAALWSSTDDKGVALDDYMDETDIDPNTHFQMVMDCNVFFDAHEADINCDAPRAFDGDSNHHQAGHDFWLNRNGHGAGFWDGDWPEPHATRLDEAARAFSSFELYVGDDGKIYA